MTTVRAARNAVALAFVLNGLCFASLVSRVPDLRTDLRLDNGGLGLLLLAVAAGSLLALPAARRLITRWGAAGVVRLGAWAAAAGLAVAALAADVAASWPLCAMGLFGYGIGVGVWDVAMNVEGAEVERRLRRTVMPRFHAGWSVGSILGAGVGVLMAAGSVPHAVHVGGDGVLSQALVVPGVRAFLPSAPQAGTMADDVAPRSAWLEPRTLAVGVMVLAFALVEGSANDWLALALIDGHDARRWVGVAGFSPSSAR
jgi:MFS family permease